MKAFQKYYFLLFVVTNLTFFSCENNSTNIAYFKAFTTELQLSQSKRVDTWGFKINYYSPEFLALAEARNSQQDFQYLLREYSGLEYYKLVISNIKQNPKKNIELDKKFQFKFNDQISIITRKDTIGTILYNYESASSNHGVYTFMLGFEPIEKEDRIILINDFEGIDVSLRIENEAIEKVKDLYHDKK